MLDIILINNHLRVFVGENHDAVCCSIGSDTVKKPDNWAAPPGEFSFHVVHFVLFTSLFDIEKKHYRLSGYAVLTKYQVSQSIASQKPRCHGIYCDHLNLIQMLTLIDFSCISSTRSVMNPQANLLFYVRPTK